MQASGDINLGVSEARARAIAVESAQDVLSKYTGEANDLIQDRILKLDDRVIATLVRENRLQVFADPGFQRTYRKAQEGAASSERDADYDLLAALLADRAARGSERPIRAGIERSIEIIDRVDDEALRGLTVMLAVMQYGPRGWELLDGLATMDRFFGQLLDGPLPAGSEWLDHLDILDAIRINQSSNLRTFSDFWVSSTMPGYLSLGVEAASAPEAWVEGDVVVPWAPFLRQHELKPGWVRLGPPQEKQVDELFAAFSPGVREKVIADAKAAFGWNIDESCREPLMEKAREHPSLKTVAEWWDQIPSGVQTTAVGRVLARANAERLDSNSVLPPLD